jgi:hypothetical protein
MDEEKVKRALNAACASDDSLVAPRFPTRDHETLHLADGDAQSALRQKLLDAAAEQDIEKAMIGLALGVKSKTEIRRDHASVTVAR